MQGRWSRSAATLAVLLSFFSVLLSFFSGIAAAQAPAAAEPSRAELLFWETIRNSNNPADFEEYLRQYPSGTFAGLARNRLRPSAPAKAAGPASNPAAAGTPTALPKPGTTWRYRYSDRKYTRIRHDFDVRVESVDGLTINETLTPLVGGQTTRTAIATGDLRFVNRPLPTTRTLVEFAPYLLSRREPPPSPLRIRSGSGYPVDAATNAEWQIIATRSPASITVPAGTFQATRMELKATRRTSQELSRAIIETGRFEFIAWYAPETHRLVRLQHRVWYGNNALAQDEVVELISYTEK